MTDISLLRALTELVIQIRLALIGSVHLQLTADHCHHHFEQATLKPQQQEAIVS
jgi:hypothetical protein